MTFIERTRRLRAALIAALIVATSGLTASTPVAAQAPAEPPPARGLTVLPPNIQLDATPGQTVTRSIAIENTSPVDQVINTDLRNFKPEEEGGQAAPTLEDSSYSMVRWMSLDQRSVRLAAGERRNVELRITVPPDAEAGSHFGSVIFIPTVPDARGGAFSVTTEVASLVLLRVPGPTDEAASVASFTAEVLGDDKGPVRFVTRLSNEGDVHYVPTGSIEVSDIFGRRVTTIPVNPESRPVLPGAVRRFENQWDETTLIGRYEAKLRLTYAGNVPGEPDKFLTAETTFQVFPPWVLIAAAAAIFIGLPLLLLLFARRRRRRRSRSSP